MRIRITEAIMMAKDNGKKVLKKEMAARLFPGIPESSQQVNFANLTSGRRKSILPEWVPIICEMCGCTADFLFGLKDE